MKRLIKCIIPLLLIALLIGSAGWYMFVYDRATVQDFLTAQARNSARNGHFDASAWFFDLSYQISGQDQNVAIELSGIYKSVGNYTKAEVTLGNAIADGATAELYAALCATYVEQDKLLDAVNMLDSISDPAIKAALDAQRPAAPTVDYAPGFYNQYISLNFQTTGGTLYVTTDGEYPSIADAPCTGPVALSTGETKLYAVVVDQNGLVSPVSILNYTIGGVVEEVILEDSSIESMIRQQLMFGEDTEIYTSDLWTITEFTVPTGATTLQDLSHLIYLEKLTIANRTISSLDFLSGMTQLQELSITNCTIGEGLEVISTLPVLKHLTLSGCGLSSINDLSGALSLTTLDLSSNAIGDISCLANMGMLSRINLSNNAVTDLSVLANLPELTVLNVSGNALTSVTPLASNASLTELDVSYNALADISALSHLTGLTKLSVARNTISNASSLAACTELRELDLSNNSLTDLSPLAALVKLQHLNFSYNAVTAMPSFPADCALVSVNGEHNVLKDIRSLGGMLNLNYVYMDYNPELADISFLADCHNLIQVNVYGTAVPTDSVDPLLERSIIVNFDPT